MTIFEKNSLGKQAISLLKSLQSFGNCHVGLAMLIDPFERHVTYLRVSVTDRCDFRCVYCMSEHMSFLPKAELLSLEELDRLCGAFISLGVKKLRITGGEPLVRKNILWFCERMGRHLGSGALDELTVTTNGSQLSRFSRQLADAGVKRINVSLDSLDADKFRHITRWGDLDKVKEGLAAAKKAGLAIKINTVALSNFNEDEIETIIRWCGAEGFPPRIWPTALPTASAGRRPISTSPPFATSPTARSASGAMCCSSPTRRPRSTSTSVTACRANISSSATCSKPTAKTWSSKTTNATSADRKSTRLNSSHKPISYAVFCLKKKNESHQQLQN